MQKQLLSTDEQARLAGDLDLFFSECEKVAGMCEDVAVRDSLLRSVAQSKQAQQDFVDVLAKLAKDPENEQLKQAYAEAAKELHDEVWRACVWQLLCVKYDCSLPG